MEFCIDKNEPLMTIGVLANMLGVHERTLRIYDIEKILCPKRTSKNRRMYSADDYERARLILFLTRNLALNLSGVKIIISLLERMRIKPRDYIECIKEAAFDVYIDDNIQKENIIKTSKRGRKKTAEPRLGRKITQPLFSNQFEMTAVNKVSFDSADGMVILLRHPCNQFG